jgi:uncharacterized membrane protein
MAFFPILLGLGLVGGSAVYLLLISRRAGAPKGAASTEASKEKKSTQQSKAYALASVLALFVVFHSILGFWVGIFFTMVGLFRITGVRTWIRALLGGVITAAISYFVFEYWLGTPFPAGMLECVKGGG